MANLLFKDRERDTKQGNGEFTNYVQQQHQHRHQHQQSCCRLLPHWPTHSLAPVLLRLQLRYTYCKKIYHVYVYSMLKAKAVRECVRTYLRVREKGKIGTLPCCYLCCRRDRHCCCCCCVAAPAFIARTCPYVRVRSILVLAREQILNCMRAVEGDTAYPGGGGGMLLRDTVRETEMRSS